MSFGKQTDVHNHLSTKHPMFSRRMAQDNQEVKLEPTHNEERFAERAPPVKVEDPDDIHSHA
jgi:hypothetical protein